MLPPRTPIVRIAYKAFSIVCANAKNILYISILSIYWSKMDRQAAPFQGLPV